MASDDILSIKSGTTTGDNPPTHIHASFFDKTPERAAARAIYYKMYIGGTFLTVVLIFSIFVIFWNAIARSPAHNLPGWIVVRLIFKNWTDDKFLTLIQDFDGGLLGQEVVQGLNSQPSSSKITWTVVSPTQFPLGVEDLARAVKEEHTWVAVTS